MRAGWWLRRRAGLLCVVHDTQRMSSGTCMHGHSQIMLILACSPAPRSQHTSSNHHPARRLLPSKRIKRPVARVFSARRLNSSLSRSNNPSQPRDQKQLCQHTCDSQGRDHTSVQNWRSLRGAGAKVGNWSRTAQHGSLSVCRDCGCSKHTCAPKQQDTHDTVHCLWTSTPKQIQSIEARTVHAHTLCTLLRHHPAAKRSNACMAACGEP